VLRFEGTRRQGIRFVGAADGEHLRLVVADRNHNRRQPDGNSFEPVRVEEGCGG
jgi:hypothetical protein